MTGNPERHGLAWSAEEERALYDAFASGATIAASAAQHQRKPGGIRGCLQKLGLLDEDGHAVQPRPEFQPSAAAQKRALKAAEKAAKKDRAVRRHETETLTPELNDRFRDALRLMEETDDSLFITGKAGTGKSTLLSYFCRVTGKQPVILAPTGVAALNVRGQTIHRFFNFYVDVTPEKIRDKKSKPRNTRLYKKLKTIIIDEVSMVRADLLDCIDVFLRLYGPDSTRPFGGVQMIFMGDLYQLPPVVNGTEQEVFSTYYPTPYFFSARALAGHELNIIELEKVYRQKDQGFVDLLNKIRNNSAAEHDLAQLNSRLSQAELPTGDAASITLTTTNAIADATNDSHLAALKGRLYCAAACVTGNFGKEYFPTAVDLNYKIGAQIMMLNNDNEKRWVNGSIGVITGVKEDDEGAEYLTVRLQDHHGSVEVYPHSWEVYRFGLEDGAIVSEPAGTFTQYPFRLAWAITIHKSQGKTFTRVVIDIGRGAFAAGQMYVALSRCTSFAGVFLKTPIRAQDIRTDHRIFPFLAGHRYRQPQPAMPLQEKIALIQQAIQEQTPLDMTYLKADDTEIASQIVPLKVGSASYQGRGYEGMKAFCATGQEERMFRIDRILTLRTAKE